MSASWSKERIKELNEALLDAFPSWTALSQMVMDTLGENLNAIAAPSGLRETIFTLVTWANAAGKIDALLDGACKEQPGNYKLSALRKKVRGEAPSASPRAPSDSALYDSRGATAAPPRGSAPLVVMWYAPADKSYADMLLVHLERFEKTGRLSVWTKDRLLAGTIIADEARAALVSARVVVPLVSADYLAQRRFDDEVPAALALGKPVLPVLVRPCLLIGTPLDGMTIFPRGNQALMGHPRRDEALVHIVEAILAEVDQGRERAAAKGRHAQGICADGPSPQDARGRGGAAVSMARGRGGEAPRALDERL